MEGIRAEEVNPEEVVAGNCVLGFNFIMWAWGLSDKMARYVDLAKKE